MQKVQQLEARVERAMRVRQRPKEEFKALTGELEAVGSHPDTDARLKKRIVRTLIEEVVLDVDGQAGEIVAAPAYYG